MRSSTTSQNRAKQLILWLCCFFLGLTALTASLAQDQETPSLADAARAARAKLAQSSSEDAAAPVKHAPFSQAKVLAWYIAGVPNSDLAKDLGVNGISFPADETHVAPLRDAKVPEDIVAAISSAPSRPTPGDPVALPQALISASQAFNSRDYAAAKHSLESLVQESPSADAYAAIGNLDSLAQELAAAQAAFEQSVQLDPTFAYAHVRLAGIYYTLDSGEQADAEAKKALELQPDNAQARKYLALSLGMKLKSGGSDSDSGRVEDLADLKANPGNNQEAIELDSKGVELGHQGNWTEAESAMRRAIQLDPGVALFHYHLGNLYLHWGDHGSQGLEAYRQAKVLAPRNMAVRQNYGHLLCEEHFYNDAIIEFREMLKMDPSWNDARPCLSNALKHTGQIAEANQVWEDYKHWNQVLGLPDEQ